MGRLNFEKRSPEAMETEKIQINTVDTGKNCIQTVGIQKMKSDSKGFRKSGLRPRGFK